MIPPPLSAVSIEYAHAIQSVSFYADATSEYLAVLLTSNEIGIAVCKEKDDWEAAASTPEEVQEKLNHHP